MAEWIISGNPDKYDVVGAFHELGVVDWTQHANFAVGDFVYIYVSGNVKALRFKCVVNRVNMRFPDIDDQKFNISGEYDGKSGRYMELELYEEYDSPAYSREELQKHGFVSPQGPIHVPDGVKSYLDFLDQKQKKKLSDLWPSESEYPVHISKNDWKRFIEEVEYTHKGCMRVLACYADIGGVGSPKVLANRYQGHPNVYTTSIQQTCRRAIDYFNMAPCPDKDTVRYFPIGFLGHVIKTGEAPGTYEYSMRPELLEALQDMDLSDIDLMYNGSKAMNVNTEEFDKNIILYGPPGTGKTYNTARYAVAICDGLSLEEVSSMPYSEVLNRYNELKDKENRIAFTTFHQSYGYEEFIEGIKPIINSEDDKLGYSIENGVFKDFCERAKAIKVHTDHGSQIKENPHIWGMILGGTGMTGLKRNCFDHGEIRLGWSEVQDNEVDGEFFGDDKTSWNAKHMVADFKNSMEIGDIVVIEKTAKSIDAIGVITGEYKYDPSNTSYPRKRSVDWLLHDIDQSIVEFLPTGRKQMARFSLYDFNYLGMEAVSHILNSHTMAPVVEVEKEDKPYVFIIDEINRGNMSKIFGELITLIEETKRAGSSEAMEAILPYSGQSFSVPNNVYIIGTMNTADRSIALMDTALRRRFSFVEMMPNAEVLESLGVGTIEDEGEELNVAKMLEVINQRIEYLFDREHTIGHAFFTKLSDDPSINTLAEIFKKSVIPLLQEYFYEDYLKIQLVLGDNDKEDEYKFILDRPIKVKDIFKGNPDIDLPEKSYVIQKDAFFKLKSYKLIGKDL